MKARFFLILTFVAVFCSIAEADESLPGAGKVVKYVLEPTLGSWCGTSDEGNWYGAFGELTLWREETDKKKSGVPVLT